MTKKKRLLLDLSRCIKLNAFANPSEVAMDYVPVLRHRLCAPLLADAADGVPTSTGYGAGGNGEAALLAMLNSCAGGVTVVNIDNGFGAGYAAALINASGVRRPAKKNRR